MVTAVRMKSPDAISMRSGARSSSSGSTAVRIPTRPSGQSTRNPIAARTIAAGGGVVRWRADTTSRVAGGKTSLPAVGRPLPNVVPAAILHLASA